MTKPAHALSSHIPYLDILYQVVHKLYKIDIALQFCHDAKASHDVTSLLFKEANFGKGANNFNKRALGVAAP